MPQCTFTFHSFSLKNEPSGTSGTWRQVGTLCSDNAAALQHYLQLKIFVRLGLVKLHPFVQRNEGLNRKCSPRMDHLWTFSLPLRGFKEEGGIRAQSACAQPAWRNRQTKFGNNWKITRSSNNFIHLLVLVTLHCLSLKKTNSLLGLTEYTLQCKLSTCYFSILFLLLAIYLKSFANFCWSHSMQ